MAATMGSETTAAAAGRSGVVRRDPFAMLPFMRLQHGATTSSTGWSSARPSRALPKIFCVNWFRKDADGKFVWPGYGENMRVLKWIIERIEGKARARSTPLGDAPDALDMKGLESFAPERFALAMEVDGARWGEEMKLHAELLEGKLEGHAPPELKRRYEELKAAFS